MPPKISMYTYSIIISKIARKCNRNVEFPGFVGCLFFLSVKSYWKLRIKQYDKRSGITYAYESHSYWDPEKKMTRARRKLIGRVDPETGEIIPTDGRNRKKEPQKETMDYESLYKKLLKKTAAQDVLIESLRKQVAQLQAQKRMDG